MAYKLTDEDRAKAKAVRDFKKQLDTKETETPEQVPDVTQRISQLDNLREKRKLRILEENENLAIELENKRMRDELSGVDRSAPEKKSELELFKQFTEIQNALSVDSENRENKMRDRIIEQISNQEGAEPESMTDIALKTLMTKIADGSINIGKKAPQNAPMSEFQPSQSLPAVPQGAAPPNPAPNTSNEFAGAGLNTMTNEETIKQVPDHIKDAIKSGALDLENVLLGFPAGLTPDQKAKVTEVFNEIKGTKNGTDTKK